MAEILAALPTNKHDYRYGTSLTAESPEAFSTSPVDSACARSIGDDGLLFQVDEFSIPRTSSLTFCENTEPMWQSHVLQKNVCEFSPGISKDTLFHFISQFGAKNLSLKEDVSSRHDEEKGDTFMDNFSVPTTRRASPDFGYQLERSHAQERLPSDSLLCDLSCSKDSEHPADNSTMSRQSCIECRSGSCETHGLGSSQSSGTFTAQNRLVSGAVANHSLILDEILPVSPQDCGCLSRNRYMQDCLKKRFDSIMGKHAETKRAIEQELRDIIHRKNDETYPTVAPLARRGIAAGTPLRFGVDLPVESAKPFENNHMDLDGVQLGVTASRRSSLAMSDASVERLGIDIQHVPEDDEQEQNDAATAPNWNLDGLAAEDAAATAVKASIVEVERQSHRQRWSSGTITIGDLPNFDSLKESAEVLFEQHSQHGDEPDAGNEADCEDYEDDDVNRELEQSEVEEVISAGEREISESVHKGLSNNLTAPKDDDCTDYTLDTDKLLQFLESDDEIDSSLPPTNVPDFPDDLYYNGHMDPDQLSDDLYFDPDSTEGVQAEVSAREVALRNELSSNNNNAADPTVEPLPSAPPPTPTIPTSLRTLAPRLLGIDELTSDDITRLRADIWEPDPRLDEIRWLRDAFMRLASRPRMWPGLQSDRAEK